MRHCPVTPIAGALLALFPALGAVPRASAQHGTAPLSSRRVVRIEDSGLVRNEGDARATVYSTVVRVSGAPWIRLYFEEVQLSGQIPAGDASYLLLTSVTDGAYQIMNSRHLEQWRNSSAYFNGDAVRIELVAYPQTGNNRLVLSAVDEGTGPDPMRSICGDTDDRVLSTDARAARVEPVGCSVWLIDDLGHCFLSAGHCFGGGFSVVEFNVPLSDPNGSHNHPPPQDQYAVDLSSVQSASGGIGNDWCYFGCFPNSTTGLTAYEAQGTSYVLAATPPSVSGQTIRITGYGTVSAPVSPTWNGVQKTHSGPYVSFSGTTIRYAVDTTGGNSGSAVLNENTGQAIGVHTNAGCSAGGGSNSGTGINNPNLQNALANPLGVCQADCNDNGLNDRDEIAAGSSLDCNLNSIPDECDLAFTSASGQLSPIGNGSPQSHTISAPPLAVADVALDFKAHADLSAANEFIDVDINGTPVGTIFVAGARDCPSGFDTDAVIVPASVYNTALGGADATITMTAAATVDANLCSTVSSYVTVRVSYPSSDNDCNTNGVPDDCDMAGATSNDCQGNGIPDECEIAGGVSQDCTGNGIPDECESDCNGNGYRDDCDLAAGTSSDCNSNAIPDECETDCNLNGFPDTCDLAAGTSADCNLNAVPDECDLAAVRALDCNTNSVPDDCDIAAGSSNDCNTNGVPDECDVQSCQELWGGFNTPPFSLNGGLHGIDADGDGATWDNPGSTAIIFPIGCQAGDVFDYAVKVSVDDTLPGPEDGHVTSEPFRPLGAPGDCDAAVYLLRLAPKIDFGIDSPWDWELIVYDAVESAAVVRLEFASTTSQTVGAAVGHILVKEPATPPGVYLDTGVPLTPATCWDIELVLDNVAGTVAVFIDGSLTVTSTPLEAGARRMDYFRLQPVDNGSVSASTTKFSLDGFGLCLTGCSAVSPSVYDCNSNGVLDGCDISSGVSTDCNGNLVADECETLVHGDFDADGDADLSDYAQFAGCITGPVGPVGAGCDAGDADCDGDVDLADFRLFQAAFATGP